MAATTIADLYIPGACSAVMKARLYDQNSYFAFKAAVYDESDTARQGGNSVTLRQNNMIRSRAFADNTTARTPGSVTMRAIVVPMLRRWYLLGYNSRIRAALGEANADVINQEIVDQTTPLWAYEMRETMTSVIKGVTDPSTGCLAATNVLSVNDAKGTGKANFNAVADAKAKNGDASAELGVAFFHSKTYNDLYKEDADRKSVV